MLIQEYPTDGTPLVIDEKEALRRISIDKTSIETVHCIGYCRYEEHEGYLTKRLMNRHGCTAKKCPHFYRKIKSPNTQRANTQKITVTERQILEYAQKITSKYEDLKAVKVQKTDAFEWTVYYATICQIDLTHETTELCRHFQTTVRFEKLNYDFDKTVLIVYGKKF